MFTMSKFRSYLLPKPFTVITTEETLSVALRHMDSSAKISKWIIQLQEYDYTFKVEDSARACLVDLMTHKVWGRKVKQKAEKKIEVPPPKDPPKLKDAHTLYFDGAYKQIKGLAIAGLVVYNCGGGEKIHAKGIILEKVHSNNEVEYQAL